MKAAVNNAGTIRWARRLEVLALILTIAAFVCHYVAASIATYQLR